MSGRVVTINQMLLRRPFGIFILGRPNDFFHERYKSLICIIECNDLLHIFFEIQCKRPVIIA